MKADEITNFVVLSGVITEKFTHNHKNYYIANLRVRRNSGKFDNFPIMCEWKNCLADIEVGTAVAIHGELRHYGRIEKTLKQIVLIRTIEVLEREKYDNFAYVVGVINKNCSFAGKSEAIIEVKRSYDITDFINIYTVNKSMANELKLFDEGETICAIGRLKTRMYKKYLENERNRIIEIEMQMIL